ncbi:hypothetical protein [Rhizobium mongolense]|uniref:Glutamine amidotransferase-like uncharacterized protein n=1 Tax=Rhizobium mongolense TaxID=57676 RepID=A0A7W6RIA1_9HYPH|nr:hypothetical protein [Rhizobium mongolense]MBB4272804.1 glutamine amidotransferase-like uncharacterized protein [Rhizobium mongolense]
MKTSSRRFSKWLVGINVALAWGAIYLGIIYLQASAVVASGLGFIGLIAGAYMGVGHADYRAFIKATAATAFGYAPSGTAGGGDFPLVDTSSQNPEAQ